jgi:GNAT superfamily N-acetyltransferase
MQRARSVLAGVAHAMNGLPARAAGPQKVQDDVSAVAAPELLENGGCQMEYRRLTRAEIERIWTIDRREIVDRVYRLEHGELRLAPGYGDVQGWPPDALAMEPHLYDVFDRGGAFYAAFVGELLVGLSVLDTVWLGAGSDLLALEFMHVSRDYRGRGVGSRLFEQARSSAQERGARGLYISATPSENTIHFYQGRGSVVIASPDAELFALEPEDIHLECAVERQSAHAIV